MKFKYNLIKIQENLNERGRERKELSYMYVAKRLNKSLNSYMSDLEDRMNYLMQRKPENVMKKLWLI